MLNLNISFDSFVNLNVKYRLILSEHSFHLSIINTFTISSCRCIETEHLLSLLNMFHKSTIFRVFGAPHCDLKVLSSQAKIDENFANYFLKTKANNECFIVLKFICKGLQKSISELER